jgi:uncharacterized protein YukE
MLLAEVLVRKRDLDSRLDELESHLVSLASDSYEENFSEIDPVVSKIYELLEERQQQVLAIDKANHSVEIKIGSSKTTLSSAVELRDTLKDKIEVLSKLIGACKNNKKYVLDLLSNKDKLLAEYNILNAEIKKKDWAVEL